MIYAMEWAVLFHFSEFIASMYLQVWHDLEVMSSNPGRVELGVLDTSVLSRT